MAFNKQLALEYLKGGSRVFETDSPDGALLIIKSDFKLKQKFLKIGLKPTFSRLEAGTYSIPFKQPHPFFDTKVNVKQELFI